MREVQVTLPELALLVGTRAALGAGLGLVLADCLSESQRKAVGWTLLLVGAVTTVPLAIAVLGRVRDSTPLGFTQARREHAPVCEPMHSSVCQANVN